MHLGLPCIQLDWSLNVVGTDGQLEVSRGGWDGNRGGYKLTWRLSKDPEPQSNSFPFTGVANEFTSFLKLVGWGVEARPAGPRERWVPLELGAAPPAGLFPPSHCLGTL